MVMLGADKQTLERYQMLSDAELQVTASVLNPNGSGDRNENLAWFWCVNILRDTDADHWMSEC